MPDKVRHIGIFLALSGACNIILGGMWVCGGIGGVMETGGGSLLCSLASLPMMIVGAYGALVGFWHLNPEGRTLKPPKLAAGLQIACIVGCSGLAMIFGILAMSYLSDPAVKDFYETQPGA